MLFKKMGKLENAARHQLIVVQPAIRVLLALIAAKFHQVLKARHTVVGVVVVRRATALCETTRELIIGCIWLMPIAVLLKTLAGRSRQTENGAGKCELSLFG